MSHLKKILFFHTGNLIHWLESEVQKNDTNKIPRSIQPAESSV